ARVARRRPPTGEHQLVKSVRALLAVEWIVETYRPIVIVVWRHPLNVLGSWLERGWWGAWVVAGVPAVRDRFALSAVWPQPPRADRVASAAWAVCAQAVLLLETAARHPRWTVVAHEELSSDPVVGF